MIVEPLLYSGRGAASTGSFSPAIGMFNLQMLHWFKFQGKS